MVRSKLHSLTCTCKPVCEENDPHCDPLEPFQNFLAMCKNELCGSLGRVPQKKGNISWLIIGWVQS